MKNIAIVAIATLTASVIFGCELITEFDPDLYKQVDGGDTETDTVDLYSLSKNIANPVYVTLVSTNGLITLDLTDPLPLPAGGDADLEALLGNAIQLIVRSKQTYVEVDLTEGQRIATTPSTNGQYTIAVNNDRNKIFIEFYNRIGDYSLQVGAGYEAKIVVESNDFIMTGDIFRDVEVVTD